MNPSQGDSDMIDKLAALAAAFVLAPAAHAQAPKAAPARAPAAAKPAPAAPIYTVKGFRSARFGMDEAGVLAAAAKDFGVADKDVQRVVNPGQGTRVLVIQVPKMDPGPGPATVQYILGAKSGQLIHVNVLWALPDTATAAQREQMIAAGLQLSKYYRGFEWAPRRALAEVPAGPNSVIAFAGQDAGGSVVELRMDGVSYSRPVNGQMVQSPPAIGPARLRLAFDQNPRNPDIAKVEQGAF
jgi:hypothetical protein